MGPKKQKKQFVRPIRYGLIEPITRDVDSYITRIAMQGEVRDKQVEHELGQRISKLREPERWVVINSALEQHEQIGLRFARQCLHSARYFEILMLRALETGNEEVIATWIPLILGPLSNLNALWAVRQSLMNDPPMVTAALKAIRPHMSGMGTAASMLYLDIVRTLGLDRSSR